MSVDHIRYDLLVRNALRDVVKRVVADAARNGLPGEHHFFIAFYTGAPGVKISPRMRAQYPEEMTIVLQHQFWDLTVNDVGIEVGLSFNGVAEKLVVPFEAMKGFFDPSVQFGLEFEVAEDKRGIDSVVADSVTGVPTAPTLLQTDIAPTEAKPRAREKAAKRPRDETPAQDTPAPPAAEAPPAAQPPERTGGGEVVSLDRFRKKHP